MTLAQFKISFTRKATFPLADNEKVSFWDERSIGTISLQGENVRLQGTWRVSTIGNILGSGILGIILIRPFFMKQREESITRANVERIVVGKNWFGKTVYHLFQSRDGGMSEVHTFTDAAGTDASTFEQFLKSIVPQDRFQAASCFEKREDIEKELAGENEPSKNESNKVPQTKAAPMTKKMRKIFGVFVLIIGTKLFLEGFLSTLMRGRMPSKSGEFIRELVVGLIGAAVLLGGAALWGWSRRKVLFGVLSAIVGGLLLLISGPSDMMKSVSIIFIIIGIVLIVKQRRADVGLSKKPVEIEEDIPGDEPLINRSHENISVPLGRKQSGGRTGQSEGDDQGLQDPRVLKAIEALMANVTFNEVGVAVAGTGSDSRVMAAANLFKELHEAYPQSAYLHFARAASLQVAMQGETAVNVLAACVQSHPDFWLAQAIQKQNALMNWNPFFLPEFSLQSGAQVHPVIHRKVVTNVLLATRQGIVPRAVIFLRDGGDELAVSKLSSCEIKFVTTISEIKTPQVVAINGRIYDDPAKPYQCEVIQCPIRPFGDKERLPYELFVRQDMYDFVVLDGAGRVKYFRHMTPSGRMKAVHQRLAQMLDTTEGPKISTNDVLSAIRRHQSIFDPKKITY